MCQGLRVFWDMGLSVLAQGQSQEVAPHFREGGCRDQAATSQAREIFFHLLLAYAPFPPSHLLLSQGRSTWEGEHKHPPLAWLQGKLFRR